MEKYELTEEPQEDIAKEIFNKLFLLDINGHIRKKKNGLSYLSWAWAWAEVKKLYPTANYTIEPYSFDEKLGIYGIYKCNNCWTDISDVAACYGQ